MSFDEEVDESAAKMKTTCKSSLRVMQWNAEAVSTKGFELAARLIEDDIDVCVLQESHLKEGAREPFIEGYKTIRADRVATVKGGLLAYVKKSLNVEVLGRVAVEATEVSTFRIQLSKNKWMHISNVYVPPEHSKGQESITLRPDMIPCPSSALICGDFNAHSILWDGRAKPDQRGEALIDWVFENNLTILNNGDATRVDRGNGNLSTPDVTLCGTDWMGRTEWNVAEPIGRSDHLPIVITVNMSVKHQSIYGTKPRWRSNNVDWTKFSEEIEGKMEGLEDLPLLSRIAKLTSTIIDAAKIHVRKVKPGKRTKVFMTPTVREAIRKRNKARKFSGRERKEEWLQACQEVNEKIKEAKEESWREVLEEAITDADERKIWRVAKNLNGTPDSNSPNEVLVHQGKRIVSSRKKADCFVSHYANVSKLSFEGDDKEINRECRRMLKHPSVEEKVCSNFTMKDLEKALRKMKRKGAPGADDIIPAFLKELGPKAKEVLLGIYNESFWHAACPQVWRSAIIVPLLKAGKPSGAVKSYRPVSLTSCMVKLMERLMAERIYHTMESNSTFSKLQAGFRRGRSCDDQILKITQAIENGFQCKQMERSVLVLLDYSAAYDTVWRQRLLLSMRDQGIPLQMIRWIASFLTNRQARVRFGDAMSKSRTMHQGLPQGSVLSPLLFIIYINNLAKVLPLSVIATMFADDVGILATHRKKEKAEEIAQSAVDVVSKWSKEWKLTLNSSKSEVSFFTTWTHEASWKPTIRVDGNPIPFAEHPRLLGVYLDCQLSFAYHTKEVADVALKKLRMLSLVSYSTWGWRRTELHKLYSAFVRGKLDYSASGWQPWLSPSNVEILDRVQNKALRIINGQMKSSPTDAVRLEARMPPYQTHIDRMCLRSAEKALRMPEDHPLHETFHTAIPAKNNRRSWKTQADHYLAKVPEDATKRKPIVFYGREPWARVPQTTVFKDVPGVVGRNDEPALKKEMTVKALNSFNADIVIYTDGSATAGTRKGGAGVVVTRGRAEDPTVIDEVRVRGAPLTSSYEEEVQAAVAALEWIRRSDLDADSKVVIATDSQSMCTALSVHSNEVEQLWKGLEEIECDVTWQWVPGHSDICGNELADKVAKEATTSEGESRPVSLKAIGAEIKNIIKPDPVTHERSIAVYSKYNLAKEQLITNRKDQVELARLRSGHHLGFNETRHRYNEEISPKCDRCDHDTDNLEHWLTCPGTMAARMNIFGTTEVELSALTELPESCIALARRTLRGAGPTAHR